jgi:hypothetical protein
MDSARAARPSGGLIRGGRIADSVAPARSSSERGQWRRFPFPPVGSAEPPLALTFPLHVTAGCRSGDLQIVATRTIQRHIPGLRKGLPATWPTINPSVANTVRGRVAHQGDRRAGSLLSVQGVGRALALERPRGPLDASTVEDEDVHSPLLRVRWRCSPPRRWRVSRHSSSTISPPSACGLPRGRRRSRPHLTGVRAFVRLRCADPLADRVERRLERRRGRPVE